MKTTELHGGTDLVANCANKPQLDPTLKIDWLNGTAGPIDSDRLVQHEKPDERVKRRVGPGAMKEEGERLAPAAKRGPVQDAKDLADTLLRVIRSNQHIADPPKRVGIGEQKAAVRMRWHVGSRLIDSCQTKATSNADPRPFLFTYTGYRS